MGASRNPKAVEKRQKVEKALASLGIATAGALLCRYPRGKEDRTSLVPLKDFRFGAAVCTIARVIAHDPGSFVSKQTGKPVLKIYIEDGTVRAALVCHNRPWLKNNLLIGQDYLIYGDFSFEYGEIQSDNFDFDAPVGYDPILPVYALTKNLRMEDLRALIKRALDTNLPIIADEIPQSIREKYHLLTKAQALKGIHFPESLKELEKATKTLMYEELFYLEVMVGKRALAKKAFLKKRQAWGEGDSPPVEAGAGAADNPGGSARAGDEARAHAAKNLQAALRARLPFSLTAGQETAIADINADMDSPFPMARLLQGDVGSGKTLVAFFAALKAVETGSQAAILAPTELLARQHADNAAALLAPLGVNVAFLTGSLKAKGRKHLLKRLADGGIDIVVGTHALFSADVVYRDLRLVVIDEQHRFGVMQRQAILAKGGADCPPDLLMMSATPIPRTLAITVFGDLDVSVIKDMPPGRKPIITHLALESNEANVYEFVRARLREGAQAYFVYPLIEESVLDLKDAVSMADRLDLEEFPEYTVALTHSKVGEEEKRQTMEAFRRGDIKILVATSVVEVGVDVPNATCMVIEHAERFGLSALHQLRGRVGRGDAQSYCFLVYSDKYTEDAKTRLMVMLNNTDGFVIAEEDLKLRGPGQIAGVEQSGYLRLGLADPVENAAILEKAREDAFAILEVDPSLLLPDHRCVAEVLERAPPFTDVGV
jgi:ATP-dependent DNA helicase RecG